MCVAIHKPAGVVLTKADVENMYFQNSDGFGAAWMERGQLKTFRSVPKSTDEAWQHYKSLHLKKYPAIIHYRLATHGSVRVDNSHPFPVIDGMFMIHNGILDVRGLGLDCSGDRTDTEAYIERYLRPVLATTSTPFDLIHEPSFLSMVGEHIGGNKFVFLTSDGRVSIANREMGEDIKRQGGRFWASNTHWEHSILDYENYTSSSWGWGASKKEARAVSKAMRSSSTLLTSHDDEVRLYGTILREACAAVGVDHSRIWNQDIDIFLYEVGADSAWESLEASERSASALAYLIRDIYDVATYDDYDDLLPAGPQ